MPEPYLGEIRVFSFAFPPRGWAQCAGHRLEIRQNQALYSLLGDTYNTPDTNPQKEFNLPDLRGRVPVCAAPSQVRNPGGSEAVTLGTEQMPAHTHVVQAADVKATSNAPILATGPGLYAKSSADTIKVYGEIKEDASTVALHPSVCSPAGGSAAHDNMQPFLVLNFCIALHGDYPPQP